jgi:mannose-6-phosphate isomerase class I
MTYIGKPWNSISEEAQGLKAIKEIHTPSHHFRFSQARYPSGASFAGASRACWLYVLVGSCQYNFGQKVFELHAGFFEKLPEGSYQFQTFGTTEVEVVRVFSLPEEFRPNAAA